MLRLNRLQKLFAIFFIPRGMYCDECPFWSNDKKRSRRENGYCSYLGKGDWDLNNGILGNSFLWDQIKECGLKYTSKSNPKDREVFDRWYNEK